MQRYVNSDLHQSQYGQLRKAIDCYTARIKQKVFWVGFVSCACFLRYTDRRSGVLFPVKHHSRCSVTQHAWQPLSLLLPPPPPSAPAPPWKCHRCEQALVYATVCEKGDKSAMNRNLGDFCFVVCLFVIWRYNSYSVTNLYEVDKQMNLIEMT